MEIKVYKAKKIVNKEYVTLEIFVEERTSHSGFKKIEITQFNPYIYDGNIDMSMNKSINVILYGETANIETITNYINETYNENIEFVLVDTITIRESGE